MGTPVRCEARLNTTLTAEQDAAGGEQERGGLGLGGSWARLARSRALAMTPPSQ